jgi:hypothetical protein
MAISTKRYRHPAQRLLGYAGVACSLILGQVMAQDVTEPTLPSDPQAAGYFPTIVEDTLLRGPNDSRSLGQFMGPGLVEGPDTIGLNATDLFRYYDNNPDFYQRNQNFFQPINKTLGIFTPHDSLTIETNHPQKAWFLMDGRSNILTREFKPELAHIKAGPLFFDVLWVGAGVIYSDYNGNLPISKGDNDDGWAAYVDVAVRGLLRITDSIYISAVANVVYLPFENEVALRFGNGDNPSLLFQFHLNEQLGEWEIHLYDEFLGRTGLDFLVDADSPAIDRAGRYHFGFVRDRSNEFYDRDQAFFRNTVGFRASRPVFENEWRLGFMIDHSDFWRTFSFDDHGTRDRLGLWLQYEGSVIPFAPRFSYEYVSTDGYRSLLHQFRIELTGRLTENLNWYGMTGYAVKTGDAVERNRFVWEFALDHTLTRSTRHRLSVGEGYFYNELQPDTRNARYLRYTIDQRITSRFHINAFSQYVERETSSENAFPMRERYGAGLTLHYRPLDFTDIRGIAYVEQSDQSASDNKSTRWIYRAEVTQQLGHRLTGNLFYQYEEFDHETRPFTEHFLGVSLRRYF